MRELELTFKHPRLGLRKLSAYFNQNLGDMRQVLDISSELYLFCNYYFEYKGARLEEVEMLGNIFAEKEVKIDIAFSVYEYQTAKYHLYKVMETVFTPELYLYLTKVAASEDNSAKVET